MEPGLPIAPSDVFQGRYRGKSVAIKRKKISAEDDLESIKKVDIRVLILKLVS